MPGVLHVVHEHPLLGGAGGTERYVHALATATGQAVFTRDRSPRSPPGLRRVEAPYPLWVLGLPTPRAPVFRDTWSVPAVEAAVQELLGRERFGRVHVHHLAHLSLGLPALARQAGAEVRITLHDYHLLCVRGQLVDRELRRCPGPEAERCACCVAEHLRANAALHTLAPIARALGLGRRARGWVAAPRLGPAELERLVARQQAAAAALAAAHRVIAPSHALAARFAALGHPGVEVVDLPLVSPVRPAPEPAPGPLRLVFVGSLIPTKGADVLVRAFAALGEAREGATLVLYGPKVGFDGQEGWADALLAQVERTPGARWGGVFGDAERQAVYAGADVLVLPSTWEENSPLVLREAVAAGLRVVASDVGGVAELDPEARLVPPGDVEALREALRAELRRGRGRRATRDWPMEAHVRALEALGESGEPPAG